MQSNVAIFLGRTPFLKILIPFIVGILLQWYYPVSIKICIAGLMLSGSPALLFYRLPDFLKLRLRWLQALSIAVSIVFVGMLMVFFRDGRNRQDWFEHRYKPGVFTQVVLLEKPVEKNRSYKANAAINQLILGDTVAGASGQIIIYFKKDSLVQQLNAGEQLIFSRSFQEIKNAGNPGGFDYKRYALFNGITHQVYLTQNDFITVKKRAEPGISLWLYETRASILGILKKYIRGPKELGLAEALLIGYRDDLDKKLLQSYSDTGVVHVIAVSGMHLALVYWLLDILLSPLLKSKQTKWLHPLLVLGVLWMFTLLTGGAASIVRAAVMFSFILLGKTVNRNTSIYNTLAASAFFLLCYNPYWLWDLGFQLSYASVLSIVIFYKPIYDLVFVRNKLLNAVWQLCAVSIAAQIITTPVVAYQFHQFPVYFLITNLLAVPISSFILIGELLLVVIAPLDFVALFFGNILSKAIWWMNSIIENLGHYPFALWKGLFLSIPQVVLLYIFIIGLGVWLMQKRKVGLWIATTGMILIFFIRLLSFQAADRQQKIIVYNIPRAAAIDFIRGRKHFLWADSLARNDLFIQKNTFQPSVVIHRLKEQAPLNLRQNNHLFSFNGSSLLVVNNPVEEITISGKIDLVVLSGNPKLYINQLIKKVQSKQVIIDGSTPAWKARYWQRDCDSLHIPCHNVVEKGAFVMNF